MIAAASPSAERFAHRTVAVWSGVPQAVSERAAPRRVRRGQQTTKPFLFFGLLRHLGLLL